MARVLTSQLWARRAPAQEEFGADGPALGLVAPVVEGLHLPAELPALQVSMTCLGGQAHAQQRWWGGPVLGQECTQHGEGLRLHLRYSRDFLWAVVEVHSQQGLLQQGEGAYRLLLRTVQERERPHLLRVWNYLPRINALEEGEERYQTFNRGRRQAFAAAGRPVGAGAPAACALGTAQGVLQVAVLAGRRPAVAIENPRQVSAYDYPRQYGAAPPLFSRAAWLPQDGGQDVLFISGTASIVGHQTVHAGDVLAQTHESVRNIQALLQRASEQSGAPPWRLEDLTGCVYVRHAADYAGVRDCLERLGLHRFCYLQADICRSDLLVEIEAEGLGPAGGRV